MACAATREDRWTDTEREQVIALWESGHSAKEIRQVAQRSLYAVQNELAKLKSAGVIQPLTSKQANERKRRGEMRSYDRRYAETLQAVKSLPNTKSAGYVIGVLYGDGFITIRGNSGSVGLKSTNQSFCGAFAQALEETFNRKPHLLSRIEPIKVIGGYVYKAVRYYEAFLHSVHIGQAIRKIFGYTDEKRWCASTEYMFKIGTDFVDGVLQGFFDAEGSFMRSKRGSHYVSACSMNGQGLDSVQALLRERGYKSRITVDRRKQWKVSIHGQADVHRFATEIGSRIDYKFEKMQVHLRSWPSKPQQAHKELEP